MPHLVLALAFAFLPVDPPAPKVDLVVHEWGTLTSVQGSDGTTLEGIHHEEEALPAFVHQIDRVAGTLHEELRRKGVARPVRGVTVKMETPVTYFYSPRALAVRARVELVHGLLSQWYPAARVTSDVESAVPIDFERIGNGALEWSVDVRAPGIGLDALPAAEAGDPWTAARIPRSNAVRVSSPATEAGGASEETETFLFYRGLARFDLPIRATTRRGALLAIGNTSTAGDTLVDLWIVHVRDGRGEVAYVPKVEPGRFVDVALPVGPGSPPLDETIAKVSRGMQKSLHANGLFDDEARAMVETWKNSYFATPGLRVLYVLPQRFTDAVLPLSVEPRPRAQVRVMVGRLECLTPEVEDDAERAVLDFAHGGDAERKEAWSRLESRGRLLEPLLRRVAARTSDENVRAFAETWAGAR